MVVMVVGVTVILRTMMDGSDVGHDVDGDDFVDPSTGVLLMPGPKKT